MVRSKVGVPFLVTTLFLLTGLALNAAWAQDVPTLHGVKPETGRAGSAVDLTLSGDGLRNLGELTGVRIGRQEIPVLGYEPLSNQSVRVTIEIPPETPLGETEITFLFGDFGMDAYFVVTEGRQPEPGPVIHRLDPHEGRVDTEVRLTLEGTGFLQLGALGGVILGNSDLPVVDYHIESDEVMFITVFLPPETPPGETTIEVLFENYGYRDVFHVIEPEPVEPRPPGLRSLAPAEGVVDTKVELVLRGEGFFALGELLELTLAGLPAPILDVTYADNQIVVAVYLPPELPTGETGITFIFENGLLEHPFLVSGPAQRGFPTVEVLVGVVIVAVIVGTGITVRRRLVRRRLHFEVRADPGIQSVELTGPSQKLGIDLRFEIEVDPGDQTVELDGGSIVDES